MSWQKKARLVIVVFVVAFVAIVVVALRHRRPAAVDEPVPQRMDKDTNTESRNGVYQKFSKDGKVVWSVKFDRNLTYPDGRSKWLGVTLTLPDRNGRTLVVTAQEGVRTIKPGEEIGAVHLTGDVRLTTSDGAVITTNEATYDDATGMLEVPGPVAFARGRTHSTGIGATYDRNRDVLWLLTKAHVSVTPDEKGQGALDATSGAAGIARADHFVRLTGSGHVTSDRREVDAEEITIKLTDDDQRVQRLELRTNSRMKGAPGGGGPQAMSARDIDLTYGADGRTLQHAQLMENGVVQLPGEGKGPGRRIAGKTIDVAMGPDGATVTNLTATEAVQVDLPAENDVPAKRIRSATLVATGAAGAGLQKAAFGGNVEYRETRAARGALPAIDRTATALTLSVETKPGFGALQQADFHGTVHIKDGPQVDAVAPRVLYHVDRDQMDLSPGDGDPGSPPRLTNGRITIDARTITFTVGTQKLSADTRVRGTILPQPPSAAPGRGAPPQGASGSQGHVPSMLAQDKPVHVTSNRLEYDGDAGHATYSGNARLWQEETVISADTIVVDDKTGNLEARTKVKTEMTLDEVDSRTGKRTSTRTHGWADTFLYDDAKRVATYTTNAHLVGAEGDVTAEKLELFLKAGANEIERLEGYASNGDVVVTQTGRTATGARLTYTAKDETYLMTGKPVVAIEITPPDCKRSVGTRLTFQKSADATSMSGDGDRILARSIPCPAGR